MRLHVPTHKERSSKARLLAASQAELGALECCDLDNGERPRASNSKGVVPLKKQRLPHCRNWSCLSSGISLGVCSWHWGANVYLGFHVIRARSFPSCPGAMREGSVSASNSSDDCCESQTCAAPHHGILICVPRLDLQDDQDRSKIALMGYKAGR